MKKLSILIILFMATGFNLVAQTEWDQKKDKNGITVFTRSSASSSLKDSKAIMVANTTVARVLEILEDIPNYVSWTPKCESAEMLNKISSNEYYYYSVTKAPMVSDRDLVVHVKVTTSGKVTTVNMKGVPDYVEEKDGLVRMPHYEGVYYLEDLGNGTIKVTLEYSADPGGKLPDWLVNTAAVDVPFDIFSNLKELF